MTDEQRVYKPIFDFDHADPRLREFTVHAEISYGYERVLLVLEHRSHPGVQGRGETIDEALADWKARLVRALEVQEEYARRVREALLKA